MTLSRIALAGVVLLAVAGCVDRYSAPDWTLSDQWVPLEGPQQPADSQLPPSTRYGARYGAAR